MKDLNSLWLWWFYTTALYIWLGSLLGLPESSFSGSILSGYFFGFVGLFVPYGFLSVLLLASPFGIISLVFFIMAMIFSQKRLDEKNYNFIKRMLLNLFALFIITFLVDVIRGTPLVSFIIFLNHGILNTRF